MWRPALLRQLAEHERRVLDRMRAAGELDGAVQVSATHPLGPPVRGGGELTRLRLVRVRRDGGASGTATVPATWTYSLYAHSASDTPPDPLPEALATSRAPAWRATVGGVGAWVQAPDWSVGLAEMRAGQSGSERWRLLLCDERLPIVTCDPGAGP